MCKLWNQTGLQLNPGYTSYWLSFGKVSEPHWLRIFLWVNLGWSLLPYKAVVVQKDMCEYTTWSMVYHMTGARAAMRKQPAELQLQETFLIKSISFCDLKFTSQCLGVSGIVRQVCSWKTGASLAWVALAQGHLDFALVEPSSHCRAVLDTSI